MSTVSSTGTSSSYVSSNASKFSIGGIISGLSTNDIIDSLMEIEEKPLKMLQAKQMELTEKLTAWRSLNTRLQAFKVQTALLGRSDSFNVAKVSSSNESILTATAGVTSTRGTFEVTVVELAKQHQMISQGYSSVDSKIGTGTVTIKIDGATFSPIKIDENNNTLEGLATAINNADFGVTASIMNDGSGSTPYRLVLNSNETGTENAMTVTLNLSGGTEPTLTDLQEATDAHIKVGNIDVYSSKNTVSGAISGVTLNLQDADESKTVKITVSQDTSSIESKIKNFISQFNNLATYFDEQFAYNSETKTSGTLFSSSALVTIKNDLYNMVTGFIPGNSDIKSLADIGISLSSAGQLAITDSSALSDALKNNLSQVSKFFSDEDDGLAVKLDAYLDQLDNTDGIYTAEEKYYTSSIDEVDSRIERKQEYLTRVQTRYQNQFIAMETALATIKSQSDYVLSQLDAMIAASKSTYSNS